jgi:hypothetical protein
MTVSFTHSWPHLMHFTRNLRLPFCTLIMNFSTKKMSRNCSIARLLLNKQSGPRSNQQQVGRIPPFFRYVQAREENIISRAIKKHNSISRYCVSRKKKPQSVVITTSLPTPEGPSAEESLVLHSELKIMKLTEPTSPFHQVFSSA